MIKRYCHAVGAGLRLLRNRSGNVAIMSGVLMPVLIVSAALAVDQGSLYLERREAQGLADLAAITAAANLANADAAALLALSDNRAGDIQPVDRSTMESPLGLEGNRPQLLVETGRYTADPSIDPSRRFEASAAPANAARVTFRKKGALFFGTALMEPPAMTTVAIAAAPAEAAISVGSRLASADLSASVLNRIVGGLLGTNLSLKVMDYEALVSADIDVLSFVNALATELRLTAATYDDVLGAEATIVQLLKAAAAAAPDRNAQLLVLQMANAPRMRELRVPLSRLLDLGTLGRVALGEPAQGLQAKIGVMDLIGAAAAVANRQNQVNLDLKADLGLAAASVELAIGEPPQGLPWFGIGETGETVRTAQTRLFLNVTVGGLGGLVPSVRLPVYLEVGHAEARLREVVCSPAGPSRVSIDVTPGVFEAWIGEVDPAQLIRFDRRPTVQPARLATLPAALLLPSISIYGSAHAYSGNMSATRVTFNQQDIQQRAVKSVSTRHLAKPLVQSLAGGIRVSVQPLGLGEGLVGSLVSGVLQPVASLAAVLDPVVHGLLTALGIRVGEADIRVSGVSCSRSVLVY